MVKSTVPSLLPLQETLDALAAAEIVHGAGSVIVTETVAVHPLLSVTNI